MNIGELVATLGVDTKGLAEAQVQMERFEEKVVASVTKINDKLMSVGDNMKAIGNSMSKYVTTPMLIHGGVMLKMYTSFEGQLAKVSATVEATASETDKWGKGLLQMAPKVGKSVSELVGTLDAIANEGVRGADALRVLEASAKASTAGFGDTIRIANLVTTAMSAYGDANIDASKMIDELITTSRVGQVATEELIGSMGSILPLAATMKVSFRGIGEAVAVATQKGIQASTAVSGINQMLRMLQQEAPASDKALKRMGSSMSDIKKILETEGVLGVLKKFEQFTQQYGESVTNQALPGMRQMISVLGIMKGNLSAVSDIQEAFNHSLGIGQEAFEQVTQTVHFKFNKAVDQSKVGLITLGKTLSETLVPFIEAVSRAIGNLISWYNNLSESTKKLIVRIGLIVAAIGPALVIFGTLSQALTILTSVGMGAIHMFNLLKLAMMTNPYTALIAVVATLIPLMFTLGKAYNKVSDSQKALNSIQLEASRAVASEKLEIDRLMQIATSSNMTKEQQYRAIKKLNEISPEYLGNITEESIRTGKASEQIAYYIKQLREKAKVEALNSAMLEEEKRYIEEVASGADKLISASEKYAHLSWTGGTEYFGPLVTGIQTVIKTINLKEWTENASAEKAKERAKNHETIMNSLTREYDKIINKQYELDDAYEETAEKIRNIGTMSGDQLESLISNIQDRITAEKVYMDSVEKQEIKRRQFQSHTNKGVENDLLSSLFKQLDLRKIFIDKDLEMQAEADKRRGEGLVAGLSDAQRALAEWKKKNKDLGVPTDTWKDYQKELKTTETLSALLGDRFDLNSAKITLMNATLKKLVSDGLSPTSEKVQSVLKAFKELSDPLNLVVLGAEKLNKLSKLLGDTFDYTGEKVSLYREQLQNAILAGGMTEEKLENLTGLLNQAVFEDAMKKLSDGFRSAAEESRLLGNTTMSLEDKVKALVATYLELDRKLIDSKGYTTALAQSMKDLFGIIQDTKRYARWLDVDQVEKDMTKGSAVIEDFWVSMSNNKLAVNAFGETETLLRDQLGLFKSLISFASTSPTLFTPEQLSMIAGMNTEVIALDNALMNLSSTKDITVSAFNEIASSLSQLGGVMNETAQSWIQWVVNVIQVIPKLMAVAEAVKALSLSKKMETKETERNTLATGLNTIGNIVNATSSKVQAGEDAGAAVSGAVKAGVKSSGGNVFVMVATIAMAVAAVLGALASIPKAKRAAGMAEGGIVPRGYSNDSYPAMLTSGETVIPPGRLPEFEKQAIDVHVTVEGKTRGQDLYYVIKEVERRYKNAH